MKSTDRTYSTVQESQGLPNSLPNFLLLANKASCRYFESKQMASSDVVSLLLSLSILSGTDTWIFAQGRLHMGHPQCINQLEQSNYQNATNGVMWAEDKSLWEPGGLTQLPLKTVSFHRLIWSWTSSSEQEKCFVYAYLRKKLEACRFSVLRQTESI